MFDINNLKNGHSYIISISPEFGDILNNPYTGETEISFSIEAVEEVNKLVVFTAAEEDNFDILDSEYKMSTEVTNLYPRTAKLEYEAGDADLNAFITRNTPMDTAGMKYLNFLAYSPEVTENPSYVILYANNALTGNKYELTIDWSGWKIISIPVSAISTATSFDGILFNMGGWKLENVTSGYILFDAVWFSKEMPAELELLSQSFPNGYTSAALQGQELVLTFNSLLDSSVTPGILVADSSGNSFTDYSYRIEENKLIITFGDLGDPSTEYTLTINSLASQDFSLLYESISIDFSSANSGVFLNDISYSDKNVNIEIENLSEGSKDLTLVAYAIGEDNSLIEKREKTFSAPAGITSEGIVFESSEEIKEVKAFVLNSGDEFVSSKYLSHKNNSSVINSVTYLPGDEAKIDKLSYFITENVAEITADFYALPDTAVVEIYSDGSIISANVENVENGLLYYYVFTSDMPSGVYPVKVKAGSVSESVSIKYVSRTDRMELLNLANTADKDAFYTKLSELKSYLSVSDSADALLKDCSKLVVLNKPYASYSELVAYMDSLTSLYEKINSSPWSDFEELIRENSALFTKINSDAVEYFLSLSGVNKGKLSQILVSKLPAESISDFIESLDASIDEFILSQNQNSGGSTGGGGSHTSKPSVSGGGISGGSFSSGTSTSPESDSKEDTADNVFTDLDSVAWAKESINVLYKKGIISKAQDGKFRPNDNITREEFTKLVVCAFFNDYESAEKLFTDSVNGAWYNKYLSAAFNIGIISGYPDGSFGVGENISREDMAVICMRAYTIAGNTLDGSNDTEFSDISQISSYALESVTKMAKAGIINGMGDNSFAPKATATRAQAAKIIASLLDAN